MCNVQQHENALGKWMVICRIVLQFIYATILKFVL